MELQGTVSWYDAGTRSGTVLLDDGSVVHFDDAAFVAGRLRLLRPGQRVRLRVTCEGGSSHVSVVTLSTYPFADEEQAAR